MKIFNLKKVEKKYEGRDYNTNTGKYEDIYKEVQVWDISKIVIFSVVSLFLLITLSCTFTTVKSGEVGLKVRFGKIVDKNISEGLNLKIPYIEKIVKVNIKVQKAELQTESSTKDLQTVNTKLAINYKVESDKAVNLYKTVGNSYEETILIPAVQESIKAVMSGYTAEETITKRNQVSDGCLEEIQSKVKKYGIKIEEFNILDLDFSEAYSQAIEEKQVAEQKVLTAQQELEKAKKDAEKKVVEAEATNKANQLLKQNVTEEVLEKQFIEKWNGELPKVIGGNGIFNISDFIK